MLIHPEHFVRTHVINVAPNGRLELQSGPGTRATPVKEIPSDGTGILELTKMQSRIPTEKLGGTSSNGRASVAM